MKELVLYWKRFEMLALPKKFLWEMSLKERLKSMIYISILWLIMVLPFLSLPVLANFSSAIFCLSSLFFLIVLVGIAYSVYFRGMKVIRIRNKRMRLGTCKI